MATERSYSEVGSQMMYQIYTNPSFILFSSKKNKMSTPTVQLGHRTYPITANGKCQNLTDSSPSYLHRDYAALRQDLDARGYLFLRGVLPTDAVVLATHLRSLMD